MSVPPSPQEIASTRGKWARCPTLSSGAGTLDFSPLLPSRLCIPLKESRRPGKDEAVNECRETSRRQRLSQVGITAIFVGQVAQVSCCVESEVDFVCCEALECC